MEIKMIRYFWDRDYMSIIDNCGIVMSTEDIVYQTQKHIEFLISEVMKERTKSLQLEHELLDLHDKNKSQQKEIIDLECELNQIHMSYKYNRR